MNNEELAKLKVKAYLRYWLCGLLAFIVAGVCLAIYFAGDLMRHIGNGILIATIIMGVAKGALTYLSVSAGVLAVTLLFYRGLDQKFIDDGIPDSGFAFFRGFTSVLFFWFSYMGISDLFEEAPHTVSGFYGKMLNEFMWLIPTMIGLILAGCIVGFFTQLLSKRKPHAH